MIFDGLFATDLKAFDIAHLFDGSMILFDLPMPVMLFGKALVIKAVERLYISERYRIMA